MKNLSAREKLILSLALSLILGYGLVEYVFFPIYQKQKTIDQEIESKILFISQYYAILHQKDFYLKKEEATRALKEELGRRFLNQETPALAGADLQRILQELGSRNSVHIVQVNPEKPKYTVGLLTVPVRITIRSSLRHLAGYLRDIENHDRFLVVENMQTRRINRNEPEYLETRLLVDGFMQQLEPERVKKT